MAMDVQGKQGVFDNINVTPLVDVFLVLLIITMVTVTLDQFTAYKVRHSQASAAEPPPMDDQIAVAIEVDEATGDNILYFGQEQIAGDTPEEQQEVLVGMIQDKKKVNSHIDTISIIPDKDAKAQVIMYVLEAGKMANIEKFALVAKVK
jgi:biopolymer transport protein ExbD